MVEFTLTVRTSCIAPPLATTMNPSASPSVPSRRRRTVLLGGLAVAVVLAGAAAAGLYWRQQQALAMAEAASRVGPGAGNYTSPDQQSADMRANLCTGSNAVGAGLRGEYFAGAIGVGEPVLVRVDSPMHFDAGLNWPDNLSVARPGSVRWSGWIKAPLAGGYRFHADTPGMRVSVANQVVAGAGAAAAEAVPMVAGRFYPITVELITVPADLGEVKLEWTAPHGARYLVPRSLLFLPTESVADAPR
jgi:hypothetical protein